MIRWPMLVLLAPLSVLAETSVYTEQGIVTENQTVKEITDSLLDKVRQDALNKTGVYIKKSSTMDASQNPLERTTVTMARLIRIDRYTTSLTPGNGPAPSQNLTLTATVSVDDNELKNLVSKEHDLNIVRRQNAVLQNQVQDLLRKRADDETSTTIVQAQALASLPQKPFGGPNITFGDLVADVPMTTPEKPNPGYDQVCRFMKEITNSIVRNSFQNNLTVKLDRIEPTSNPEKAIAHVSIGGNVSWDWSEQANLMAKFFGDAVTIKGNVLTLQKDNDLLKDGEINCMGQIRLYAVLANKQNARIDNANGTNPDFVDEDGYQLVKNGNLNDNQRRDWLISVLGKDQYRILSKRAAKSQERPDEYVLYFRGDNPVYQTMAFPVSVNGEDANDKNVVQIIMESRTPAKIVFDEKAKEIVADEKVKKEFVEIAKRSGASADPQKSKPPESEWHKSFVKNGGCANILAYLFCSKEDRERSAEFIKHNGNF